MASSNTTKIFLKYKGIHYETQQELGKAMIDDAINDGTVKEQRWETIEKAMEDYTPEKFISNAKDHAGADGVVQSKAVDVVQAAENLWGAATSALKRFYLKLGLDLKSPRARNFFLDTALNHYLPEYKFPKERRDFWDAWSAVKKHFYEHDENQMDIKSFRNCIGPIEKFVKTIGDWDSKEVEERVRIALGKPEEELGLRVTKVNRDKKFAGEVLAVRNELE